MAVKIGQRIMPDMLDQLRVAALLHDISKEYSEAEFLQLVRRHNLPFSDEDMNTTALWHSITAPLVVYEEFSEYATDNVLSAVYNHTVGSPDMTVFDEIILLSDYIEEGKNYPRCVELRQSFLDELEGVKNVREAILLLHLAVVRSLDNNINEFESRGKVYHSRTKLTRDAILNKIERQNNG